MLLASVYFVKHFEQFQLLPSPLNSSHHGYMYVLLELLAFYVEGLGFVNNAIVGFFLTLSRIV